MLQQGTTLLVIRYVEPETASIGEDLVRFLECDSGITGKALADKMLGFIRNHLDPSKMPTQAYDGASNMSEIQTELQLEYLLSTPSPFTPIALLTV